MKIAGRGRRDASAIGGHWLLSFRKREAQRNLLTAGTIGSQGGIKRALSDCNRHNPPPEPTLPAVSRFLCASRFRNDKRETALKANSQQLFRLQCHDIGRLRRSVRLLERIGYLQYIGAGGQVELVQGVYTTHSQPACVAIAGERSADAFGGAVGAGGAVEP